MSQRRVWWAAQVVQGAACVLFALGAVVGAAIHDYQAVVLLLIAYFVVVELDPADLLEPKAKEDDDRTS